MSTPRRIVSFARRLRFASLLLAMAVLVVNPLGQAQPQNQSGSQQTQQPDQASPDSGGPGGDTGVIAVPRKNPSEQPPPAPPARQHPRSRIPRGWAICRSM